MDLKALIPGHFLDDLRPLADVLHVTLIPYDPEGNPQADARDVQVLFLWWLGREQGDRLIRKYPHLQWIHTGSAGIDHILTPTFLQSGVTLTNSAGVHATSIAEWVVAAMLALQKDLRLMFAQQENRVWQKVERDELVGKHIVVLGAGRTATEIARRVRPFGVKLTCIRRTARQSPEFDQTWPVRDLETVVHDADWLIVAIPLTAETKGIVGPGLLNVLPPTCRIVNIARGGVIDEPALVKALQEKRLAGAVLDVFAEEPLPSEHPFWPMPHVILLPHTTGNSPQVRQKQLELFSENLRRFVRGEPLMNVVDVKAGY